MSHETQDTITAWQRETFGPCSWEDAWDRFMKEVEEADELVKAYCATDLDKLAEECADIHITMLRVLDLIGARLQAETDRKMSINRKRKWNVNGGVGQHVKCDEADTPPHAARFHSMYEAIDSARDAVDRAALCAQVGRTREALGALGRARDALSGAACAAEEARLAALCPGTEGR